LLSLALDLFMPLQTPETLLLTFFSCSQTTLPFEFLLLFSLFALTLLLHSMLFLFSLAFFSLGLRELALGLLFLFDPLTPADVLGRLGLLSFLLALGSRGADFFFLCLTSSRLLVLFVAFLGLLLSACDGPTLGRLGNPIGLFGPLLGHHVSHGDLLAAYHRCLNALLACHQHALFPSPGSAHWLWWSSHPSLP